MNIIIITFNIYFIILVSINIDLQIYFNILIFKFIIRQIILFKIEKNWSEDFLIKILEFLHNLMNKIILKIIINYFFNQKNKNKDLKLKIFFY